MTNDPTRPTECAAVFVVRDIAASLAYFRDALGFDIAFTWGEPTFYAGVCRGKVTIHLQAASQTSRPAGASALSVFVGNADDLHGELVRRGARVLKEPATYPYGMRDFDVSDLDGNTLIFGSPDPPMSTYRGEFRYVFHSPRELFDATVAFYRDALRFPVVGGFANGTYFQASAGVIEVITDPPREPGAAAPADPYRPPHKGWLLIEVPDLDAAYQRLIDAKSAPLWAPQDRAWRFRDVGVKDPCGNLVCLFCRLEGWEQHHG